MMMEEISEYEDHISANSKCDSEVEDEDETDRPTPPHPEKKPLSCQLQPSMYRLFVQQG